MYNVENKEKENFCIIQKKEDFRMEKIRENKDVVKAINKMLIDKDSTKADIARGLNVSRQRVSNILNKANLSFADIVMLCNALDLDLYIEFRDRLDKAE